MVKRIELTQGQYALVDDEDYEFLNQWKWHAAYYHSIKGFYAAKTKYLGKIDGKKKCTKILMHRLITDAPNGKQIDHINHNPLDNQRNNLRIVTNRQNHQNRKKNSSKYPGVHWNQKDGLWVAHIQINGKLKHLGCSKNEDECFEFYKKAVHRIGEKLVCELKTAKEEAK